MPKTVIHWTKKTFEIFVEEAMLSELETAILEERIKGLTVTEMSMKHNVSASTIHSIIKKMREKYDIVQKQHPDVFPIQRVSKEEIYMDNN